MTAETIDIAMVVPGQRIPAPVECEPPLTLEEAQEIARFIAFAFERETEKAMAKKETQQCFVLSLRHDIEARLRELQLLAPSREQ